MTEPRRHDTDPRPPYDGTPGSNSWPTRRARHSRTPPPDPFSPRPDAAPGSFGQDRGSSWWPCDGGLSRSDPEPYSPGRYRPATGPPSTRLSQAHSRAVPTRAAGTWAGVRRAAVDAGWAAPEPDDRAARTRAGPPLSPMTGPAGPPAGPPPSPMTGAARTPAGPPLSPMTGPAGPPAGPPPSPMTGPGATRAPAIGVSVTQVPASRARAIRVGVYQTPMAGTCAPRPSGRPAGPARAPVTGTTPGRSRSGRSRSGRQQTGPRQQGSRRASRGRRRRSSAAGPSWRWGQLSGGRGTLIVLAAAVLGTGVTVGTHHDPGYLLGGAVIAGTFVAALAVRREAVYQLIPVPALAYLVGALTAGLMHEQGAAPSRTGLAFSATQWVAGGFVTMAAATVVAAAITVIRWLMNRHAAASGTPPRPEPLAADRLTSRSGSFSGPGADPWAAPRPRPLPQPTSAPRPEPPFRPWPEEPAASGRRASRREPPPPADPYSRRRSAPWPEPPSRPSPPSFGAPHDLMPTNRPGG